jgi:hypothetical protein
MLMKTLVLPAIVFPAEGLVHAVQTKNLMKAIVRETGGNLERLRQIDLSKMDLNGMAPRTPLRHGLGVNACVLPCNTDKTRRHLKSILLPATHERLDVLLNDRGNFVRRTIRGDSCEGATLNERGWQKVLSVVLEA